MVLSSNSIKSSASHQQPKAALPLDSTISGSETPRAYRDTLLGSDPQIPLLAKIPEDEREELEALTDKERFQHATTFSKMFVKLGSLLASKLEVDDLTDYLDSLVDPRSKLPYVDHVSYQHCSTTKQVLRCLCPRYIHAYHLDLLKEIVDLSESAEARAVLCQYESTLRYSIPLSQLESPLTEDNIKACRSATTVQIIVDRDPDSFTLKDVEQIKSILEQATGVNRVAIVPAKHQLGSVVLTFLVPENAAEHFVSIEADKAALATLADIHVVEIKVGEDVSFPVPTSMVLAQSDPGVPRITLLEAGGMLTSLQLEDEPAVPRTAESSSSPGTTVQEQETVSSSSFLPSMSAPTSKMSSETGMATTSTSRASSEKSRDSSHGSRAPSLMSVDSGYGSRASSLMSVDSGYGSRVPSLMSVDSGYGSRASSLMSADSDLGSTGPLRTSKRSPAPNFSLSDLLSPDELTGPSVGAPPNLPPTSSEVADLVKQISQNQTGPSAQ